MRSSQAQRVDSALEQIHSRGWARVGCENANYLLELADSVLALGKRLVPTNAGTLQEQLSLMPEADLNKLSLEANFLLGASSEKLALLLPELLCQLAGRSFFIQRRPYFRVNKPGSPLSGTPTHSDVFYGHSPFAFTIWIPLHDIPNDDGLFIYSAQQSRRLIGRLSDSTDVAALAKDAEPAQPIKMRFGEVLIFRSWLLHGARPAAGDLPRASIDTRVQPLTRPLFEKASEVYGLYRA